MFSFNETAFKDLIKIAVAEALNQLNFNQQPHEKQGKVEYLTAKETEKLLKISHTTLYNLIHAGKLKPIKLGRRILFSIKDIEKIGDPDNGSEGN
jgi:excisionase family DNA binding protein